MRKKIVYAFETFFKIGYFSAKKFLISFIFRRNLVAGWVMGSGECKPVLLPLAIYISFRPLIFSASCLKINVARDLDAKMIKYNEI